MKIIQVIVMALLMVKVAQPMTSCLRNCLKRTIQKCRPRPLTYEGGRRGYYHFRSAYCLKVIKECLDTLKVTLRSLVLFDIDDTAVYRDKSGNYFAVQLVKELYDYLKAKGFIIKFLSVRRDIESSKRALRSAGYDIDNVQIIQIDTSLDGIKVDTSFGSNFFDDEWKTKQRKILVEQGWIIVATLDDLESCVTRGGNTGMPIWVTCSPNKLL